MTLKDSIYQSKDSIASHYQPWLK